MHEFNKISCKYPTMNFFDIYILLKENPNLFPFVNFKDLNTTCEESAVFAKTQLINKCNNNYFCNLNDLHYEYLHLYKEHNESVNEFLKINQLYTHIIGYMLRNNYSLSLQGIIF
jgi:hypothetical protein